MKRVSLLRTVARIIQCGIFLFLFVAIIFCLYFVMFQDGHIDHLFVFSPVVLCLVILLQEITNRSARTPFLKKVNLRFRDICGYVRDVSEIEKGIVQYFFEQKGWKIPLLFSGESLDCTACVCRVGGKTILLVDELVYYKYTLTEIWTILAHEKGHLLNGDILLLEIESKMLFFLYWLPRLFVLKIFIYLYYFPGFLLYSPSLYLFIFFGIMLFFAILQQSLLNTLEIIAEILADNTASLTFDSPHWMLQLLEDHFSESRFFSLRKKALLWVYKKDV